MNRFDAIAFDLDGTLVDSAGGIAWALNSALAGAGLPGFDTLTVRAWIGDGPDVLIARALATGALASQRSEMLAARLRRDFDAATLQAPMAGSEVFEGIRQLLGTLAVRLPLVVVTNKPGTLARAVLEAAGLLAHFTAVHGADSPSQRKPSPLLVRQAAGALGVAPARLLMVGDAGVDIAAARAAGSRAAWAGWGYGHAIEHTHMADVWRLTAPNELLAHLALPASADTAP